MTQATITNSSSWVHRQSYIREKQKYTFIQGQEIKIILHQSSQIGTKLLPYQKRGN